ncbi:N-acetyltransferase [Romboutsia sp. 1001216sp1]|uniref:GNAT family N-acetyltransferase n=1 Tax=unclassified Romboutsia TaxID=2626894 RepID=UPI00189D05A7|nr:MULTISPECIES: N-acetyltransferase [unclassified Romboutsia]MDB8792088.1 N-acetyltransferase [Romboutsia sp. 1001216sp1]MDB8801429.1 N-acetyltransferase [Romboutsia sp. 1001216sp1]MDB8812827.1 N-acetyltransferase [Romboutsia sp. 1001216sp1]
MINIRCELEKDYNIVENVVKGSFKNEEFSDKDEHNLVNRLRNSKESVKELALLAEVNEEIVGYSLLTKIKIKNKNESRESLALAPVSVLPEYQKKGVGSTLINKAIEKAKNLGYTSIVVLGHPNYYLKFGFINASEFDIKPPFEVPDDVFKVLVLDEEKFKGTSGVVEYSSVFFE